MKVLSQLKELLFESGIYSLANIFTRFLQILLLPLYTRLLSPGDYGILAVVTTVSTILGIFVTFQLDSSVFRWFLQTEDENDRKKTFASWIWCQLSVSSAVTLIIFLYQIVFGLKIQNGDQTDDIGIYLVLASATIIFMTFENAMLTFLRVQRKKWASLIAVVVGALITILITIYLVAVLKWGVFGVLAAGLLANILKGIFVVFYLRGWLSPGYFNFPRFKEMLAYSLPLVPAGLSLWIVGLVDRLFLIHYSSAAETGLYHIGNSLSSIVTIIVTGFLQAWSPFAFSISETPDAKKTYAAALEFFLIITCLVSVITGFFSPEILRIVTTEPYYEAYNTVGILCLSNVLLGVYQISGIGLALVKKTTPIFYATFIAAIINIVLNFILIPPYGRMGAAWATLLSVLVIPLYLFAAAQKYYFIPYRFGNAILIFGLSVLIIVAGNYLADRYLLKFSLLAVILIVTIPYLLNFRKLLAVENPLTEKA